MQPKVAEKISCRSILSDSLYCQRRRIVDAIASHRNNIAGDTRIRSAPKWQRNFRRSPLGMNEKFFQTLAPYFGFSPWVQAPYTGQHTQQTAR
jgi:hypothetical protein